MDNNGEKVVKNEYKIIKYLIFLAVVILIVITLGTGFEGAADIGDYADTAKFFAGEYNAKIRNTHSYLFGFIHAPLVGLTGGFLIFKIINFLVLLGIGISLYFISGKDEKVLYIFIFAPVVWYMAPWISPIILASLFLLWAYYFIEKYDSKGKLSYLFFSGVLIGLGLEFWDAILYFGGILGICYLFNKRFYHFLIFIFAVLIGLSPRLIFDQIIFNFAFFTVIKTFLAGITFSLLGGNIYGLGGTELNTGLTYIAVLLAIPLFYWILYSRQVFSKNKKVMVFLTLSLLMIALNPQIRYILVLTPIMILLIAKYINEKQVKRQVLFSILIILLFIFPYVLQVNNNIDDRPVDVEFTYLLKEKFKFEIEKGLLSDKVRDDLIQIADDFPNETFLVGPEADRYAMFAHFYWGDKVKEFVSIQDYTLFIKNESVIFQRTFMPSSNIDNRRQVWIAGGINKNERDNTDYDSIRYMINYKDRVEIEGFEKIGEYKILSVWRKNG